MGAFIGSAPPSLALNLNNGTLTSLAPVLTLGQTWNHAGVHFTGFRCDFQNNASGAYTTVFDFRVSGATVFAAYKTGQLVATSGSAAAPTYSFVNDFNSGLYSHADDQVRMAVGGVGRMAWWGDKCSPSGVVNAPFWSPYELRMDNANVVAWASTANGGATDVGLSRNAAGLIEINSGTPGALRDWKARRGTFTEHAALQPTTEPASPATGLLLFCVDNGGKMELKVKSPSGDVGTLYTEP